MNTPLLAGTHHIVGLTCGPTKLTGTESFVNLVNTPVTVSCPSNGHSAFSTSGLLAPAAQSTAGRVSCSCLPWPVVLPRSPHRPHTTPTTSQAIPPLTHTPCYSAATAASHRSRTNQSSYSSPRGHPLRVFPGFASSPSKPRVIHRLGALDSAWSTSSRNDFHRKRTVRGEADS